MKATASFTGTRTEPVTSCEQLPAVDNSRAQLEIEIAVNPGERGSDAEKGGEGVTMPADLATPGYVMGDATMEAYHTLRNRLRTGSERHLQASTAWASGNPSSDRGQGNQLVFLFESWCAVGGLDPGAVKRKAMAATS